jgi:hypothetical protein
MAKKATTTSKSEALSLARQCHGAIRDFLNQEPTHTEILTFLRDKAGDGKELQIMRAMLESNAPISNEDISRIYLIAESTVSKIVKNLDRYLRQFASTLDPLKAPRKTIGIPLQVGGNNIGYHFACFNNKTKKVLDGPATVRLIENLWDEFIMGRLCKKLKEEATTELSKKLEGRDDYQILDMEIGLVPDRTQQECLVKSYQKQTSYDHNRTWKPFNLKSFFESRAFYIISVDAGRGKTTFLRHLQLEYLHNTELIPIFLEAPTIEEWRFKDRYEFAENLAKHYDLIFPDNHVADFIVTAFDEKMVFLIDGLDQIKSGGREYEHMVDYISRIMENNVIIASRPSAVVNMEEENKYKFIRLKSFDQKAQTAYFGKHYDRAKELSRYSPDLIAVPMLAYMVRMLSEEGKDKDINTRTTLYQKFIEHILIKYKHGKTRLPLILRTQIQEILGKIAYFALAEKEPHIQKIPLDYCFRNKLLANIFGEKDSELLTKSGLVNLIVEQSGFTDKDFLFFTHQSFQEYLAAEYASTDEILIDHILAEKWNLKWEETIKFITGLRGQEIIERILKEKDNIIHSKLFLSSKLILETKVTGIIIRNITDQLEELRNDPIFASDANIYWVNINPKKAIEWLLKESYLMDYETYMSVISTIHKNNIIRDENVPMLIAMLNSYDEQIDPAVIDLLCITHEKVDISVVNKVANILQNTSNSLELDIAILNFLETHKNVMNYEIIKKIANKLNLISDSCDEAEVLSCFIISILQRFTKFLNEDIIMNIASRLDTHKSGMGSAIDFFREHPELANDEIVRKTAMILDSDSIYEVLSAMLGLEAMVKLIDDNIALRMATKLQYPVVGMIAARTLRKMPDFIESKIQDNIIHLLEDKNTTDIAYILNTIESLEVNNVDYDLTEEIYYEIEKTGAVLIPVEIIVVLGKINELEGRKICSRLATMLANNNKTKVLTILEYLSRMKHIVDYNITNQIAKKLSSRNKEVISSTIKALMQLDLYIDTDIVKKMASNLKSSDNRLVDLTISALEKYHRLIDLSIINILSQYVNKKSYALLKSLYCEGKLDITS